MRRGFKASLGLCALAALALSAAGQTGAGEKKTEKKAEKKVTGVKIGSKAPAFESVDEGGKPWKSADHVGKKVLVLYFYPADFTGGCTAQACGFRDDIEKLGSKDVEVVGVSGDSP